jgi:hypothetical protein
VVAQLSGGWLHNYSTKTRQAGHANEKSMYYGCDDKLMIKSFIFRALPATEAFQEQGQNARA